MRKINRGMKMNIYKKFLNEQLNEGVNLSDALKKIAIDFVENTCESQLYKEMALLNLSDKGKIYGRIDFDLDEAHSHKTRYEMPGGSIELSSFEIDEDLTLKIHKTVSIGFNSNKDVERYAGHDYIAASVNNTKTSTESFKIKNASDVLDIIDLVCTRSIDEQIAAINDINTFENGESFSTFIKINNKVKNGEKVKFSDFVSSNK